MNLIKKLSIKGKVLLIVAMAVLLVSYFTGKELINHFKFVENKKQLTLLIDLSEKLSALIHETQKERGASAGYLGSHGKKFSKILIQQRKMTDDRVNELKNFLNSHFDEFALAIKKEIQVLMGYLNHLPEIRKKVSNFQISVQEEVKWYSQMNAQILKITGLSAIYTPSEKIAMDLAAYTSFLKAKERAGIERAVLSATFGADKFLPGLYTKFISLLAQQKAYLDDFLTFANPQMKKMYFEIIKHPAFAEVQKMRDIAISHHKTGNFGVNAEYWFKTITKKINYLRQIDNKIVNIIKEDLNSIKDTTFIDLVIGIVGLLIIIFVSWLIIRSFSVQLRSIKNLILQIAKDKDLSIEIRIYEDDEFGEIRKALREFIASLHEVMIRANQTSQENKIVSNRLTNSFEIITDNIHKETSIVSEASKNAEEIKDTLEEESEKSNLVKNAIIKANEDLKNSVALIEQTVKEIQNNAENEHELASQLSQLSQDAEQVKDILTVIREIADQTNLLALNAAIEAARAGEHGRGFAVVADEVRKLAERTQKSLGEIDATINVIVQSINNASNNMNRNIEVVTYITDKTLSAQSEIEHVSKEMNNVVKEVEINVENIGKIYKKMDEFIKYMENIRHYSLQNEENIMKNRTYIEKIAHLANELLEEIKQFKI